MTATELSSTLYPVDRRSSFRWLLTEDNVGYLVKQVSHSLGRRMDQEMLPLGLTASQWRPIALLATKRADTAVELADLAGIDTGAMTRTLSRLEAKGLLKRTPCQKDRRVVRIRLTQDGLEKAQEIPINIARVLNHHLRGFSADELTQLMHFLQRMLANGSMPSAIEQP